MKTQNIEFTRIENDVNGNPRYVCHYLNLSIESDKDFPVTEQYDIALKRAKKIGGKKYHNKKYGGGIVFQSFNIKDTEQSIMELLKEIK